MRQLKFALYSFLMVAAIMCSAAICRAQGPGDTDDPPPNDVPIDGGVSLLVGAAALYGAKKLKSKAGHRQDSKN